MNYEEILRSEAANDDFIFVKKMFVKMGGGLSAGVLLSRIVFWHQPNKKGNSKLRVNHDGHYWVARRREDWQEECCLTPKMFDHSAEKLEAKGLIVTNIFKFNGSPTKHIRLSQEGFTKAYNAALAAQESRGEDESLQKVNIEIDERSTSLTESTTEHTTLNTAEQSSEIILDKNSQPTDAASDWDAIPGVLDGEPKPPKEERIHSAQEAIASVAKVMVSTGGVPKNPSVADPRFAEKALAKAIVAPLLKEACKLGEVTSGCRSAALKIVARTYKKHDGSAATQQEVIDLIQWGIQAKKIPDENPFFIPNWIETQLSKNPLDAGAMVNNEETIFEFTSG